MTKLPKEFLKKFKDFKTFEDACKISGLDSNKVIPDFSFYPKKDRKAMIAHAKLVIIVCAANKIENDGKEWIPDWSNWDEIKYESWFYLKEGSSGFRSDVCDGWSADTDVGSRLCFKSLNLAKYIAIQFIDLYKAYFL